MSRLNSPLSGPTSHDNLDSTPVSDNFTIEINGLKCCAEFAQKLQIIRAEFAIFWRRILTSLIRSIVTVEKSLFANSV